MRGAVLLATDLSAGSFARGAARFAVVSADRLPIGESGRDKVALYVATPADDPDEAQVAAAAEGGAAGLWLTRCRGRADLERAGAMLAVAEARAGLAEGALRLVASVGTAAGVLGLPGLSAGSRRFAGLALNEGALGAELGLAPGAPRNPAILQARAMVVLAACAAGVPAIDAITPSGSARALEAAARAARQEGFAAKLAAGMDQVAPIERAFA